MSSAGPSSSATAGTGHHDHAHGYNGHSLAPPPPPPSQPSLSYTRHRSSRSPSPGGGNGGFSPPSSQSSPYVSPRPPHRVSSDSASVPVPNHTPLLRRGAVSGASGPLSFPPLPSPFRHASAGPGDGTNGTGPNNGRPPYYDNGAGPPPPPPPPSSSSYYYREGESSSSTPAYYGQGTRLPSFSAGGPPGMSVLNSTSAAAGPNFPISSSYSLSATSSPVMGSTAGNTMSSPAIGAQRRGGLSASSGTGVYGAAAQLPPSHHYGPPGQPHHPHHPHAAHGIPGHPHPYWTPSPMGTGAGLKRKQTSANPPPRNYACPSCPASFSRRHDLNR